MENIRAISAKTDVTHEFIDSKISMMEESVRVAAELYEKEK